MHINPLHTISDYEKALERLEKIMDAQPGEKEFEELEVLSILIEHFEEKKFPISAPDPIEAIKFRMEQLGLNRADLEKVMACGRGRVSEVLNKKRPLTLSMIRALHQAFQIPSDVLVQKYSLTQTENANQKNTHH